MKAYGGARNCAQPRPGPGTRPGPPRKHPGPFRTDKSHPGGSQKAKNVDLPLKNICFQRFRGKSSLAANSGPRAPKRAPRGPTGSPKGARSGPGAAQERAKSRQEQPKRTPRARAQNAPPRGLRRPRERPMRGSGEALEPNGVQARGEQTRGNKSRQDKRRKDKGRQDQRQDETTN